MKKIVLLILVICFLFTGCASVIGKPATETTPTQQATTEPAPLPENTENLPDPTVSATEPETATRIYPLSDTTMDDLSDGIFSIALKVGGVYADETGKPHMEIEIYSYDKYDMVDISMMKVGDILVTNAGEIELTRIETKNDGSISVNGGLYEDGFDLTTDDSGIFYESGYNNARNWYKVGDVILSVSDDFVCYDSSDLEQGDKVFTLENFLNGDNSIYGFTPFDTTIRVENGQIVEMNRVYTP